MPVHLLYFNGCPNHVAVLPRLRQHLTDAGISEPIELVLIRHDEDARRRHFLGSPTIRIDGEDVEPGARYRDGYGLKCRLFVTPDGVRGTPPDDWITDALARAQSARGETRS